MFDGMPDQFYQFLAAARTATTTTPCPNSPSSANSLSLPLSFSLHHNHGGSAFTPTFDPSQYPLSPQPHPQQGFLSSPPITHLLHHSGQLAPTHLQLKNEDKQEALLTNSELHQIHDAAAWSNDEVLALLRIRSTLDNNWFPDLITWENVSRKLGELGFKRSAEKCKEKFEEETRSFNSSIDINASNQNCSSKNNVTSIQNYRLFGELEDLCNTHHHHPQHHHNGVDNNDQDQDQCPPPPQPPQADDQPQLPSLTLSEKNESPPRSQPNDEEEEEEEEDKAGQEMERSEEVEEKDRGNDKVVGDDDEIENSVDDSEKTEENTKRVMRKRKRHDKFDMFKGFCESIVNKMMAQQEQLHCKILQDMLKRDEEKLAREQAWKNQHFDRIQKQMKVRANDLAIAGHRQAKILAFLNNFTSSSTNFSLESHSLVEAIENLLKLQNDLSISSIDLTHDSISSAQQPTSSSCTTHDQNPSFLLTHNSPNNMPTSSSNETLDTSKLALPITSPSIDQDPQNPNEDNNLFRLPSSPTPHNPSGLSDHTNTNAADKINTNHRSPETQTEPKPKSVVENGKDDTGRRWPRDEVLALINIRSSLFSNGNNNNEGQHESKEQCSSKGIPLWERISQRMLEMGYKRSAKRCKEKWENINKYFRKTKDLNKKRSIDSRTCPYFHQLSHLYSKGGTILMGTSDPQVSHLPPRSPEARTTNPAITGRAQAQQGSSEDITLNGEITTVHGGTTAQAEEGAPVVQVSALDFEF